MKRTPLKRKTPLRAKATRRPRKPLPKVGKRKVPWDDKASAERAHVMRRDGYRCVAPALFRLGLVPEPPDECRNQWGDEQTPAEPLTVEHAKCQPGIGIRAPHDRWHLAAACHWHNAGNHWLSKWRHAVLKLIEMREGAQHPVHN